MDVGAKNGSEKRVSKTDDIGAIRKLYLVESLDSCGCATMVASGD
jgi:hypothetical protein